MHKNDKKPESSADLNKQSIVVLGMYCMLTDSGLVWSDTRVQGDVCAHLMARGEEEHLEIVFEDEYRDTYRGTARYVGLPRR